MTPTSKPAVTPEMVEKARLWLLEHGFKGNTVIMAEFAASAVQDAVSDAIKLVEHFANDELTPKEWPEYGLVKREGRFDNGFVAVTCEHVAAALREKYGVKP